MKVLGSFVFLVAVAAVTAWATGAFARLVYEALMVGWGVLG